eukprot:GHRQ01023286.1.p2 GENE.GHRQ01023286.1~~GHRQ01023286.1.p2  ORF type:complete len:121 (+),score=4.18 GHRQ01023286.1:382-744(+)
MWPGVISRPPIAIHTSSMTPVSQEPCNKNVTKSQQKPRWSAARTQLLVDLVFNRQAMAVPAEAARHVSARGARVTCHNVLQARAKATVFDAASEMRPNCVRPCPAGTRKGDRLDADHVGT